MVDSCDKLPIICNRAKEVFNLTDDPREAGFILCDGSMLDFSGKEQGGTLGTRERDHTEIQFVSDIPEAEHEKYKNQPKIDRYNFPDVCSAIRFHFSKYKGGEADLNIDIANKPLSTAQEQVLKKTIDNYNIKSVFIDVNKPNPDHTSAISLSKEVKDPTIEKIRATIDQSIKDIELPWEEYWKKHKAELQKENNI